MYPAVTAVERNSTNPNDTLSCKAVDLVFYNEDNAPVGTASVSSVDTPCGFLYNVEVYPKFRGQGYGDAIVNYMVTRFSITELTVAIDNRIAISLYKKFGFERAMDFEENGRPMLDMRRR